MGKSAKYVALDTHKGSIMVVVVWRGRRCRVFMARCQGRSVANLSGELAGPCGYGVCSVLRGLGHKCAAATHSLGTPVLTVYAHAHFVFPPQHGLVPGGYVGLSPARYRLRTAFIGTHQTPGWPASASRQFRSRLESRYGADLLAIRLTEIKWSTLNT